MTQMDTKKCIGMVGIIAFIMGSWSTLIMLAFNALHIFHLSAIEILSPVAISTAIAALFILISMRNI